MRHSASIPPELHSGAGASVKEALGTFWSSVFRDQDLVDAAVSARVLSTCQAYIDIMEALSLRYHSEMPVFHREHWHPLLVRLSERNTGCGLVVGMEGDPVIGAQGSESIFREGEVFVVGGNAEYSKVNTYPLDASVRNILVSAGTCICDSIVAPEHILAGGRDFMLRDGVLLIRKEQDPFTAGGYRIVEDGDDRIAVLWMCDAEFDRNHVGDFLAYPLGFDVRSTPESARMLSALWDVVIYGMTPRHLNILLGAIFGVPVVTADTVVERIDGGDIDTVVTSDGVYQVQHDRRAACCVEGAELAAGTFLTDEVRVYHGLSQDEFLSFVDDGSLPSIVLPAGSIAGVDSDVELSNMDSPLIIGSSGSYEWFKLNADDDRESPFWQAVFARTTVDERYALLMQLADLPRGEIRDPVSVNPLRKLGYLALANTVLVYTSMAPLPGMCATYAVDMLRRLMPAYGSVQFVQEAAPMAQTAAVRSVPARGPDIVTMDDSVECGLRASADAASSMCAASDDVAVRFIPDAATEV